MGISKDHFKWVINSIGFTLIIIIIFFLLVVDVVLLIDSYAFAATPWLVIFFRFQITIANFPQHPANCFMNEIVFIV